MKRIALLILLLSVWLAGCAKPGPADPHEHYGTWQSSEPRTLAQVETASLTEKQREVFETPGFWGQLRLTYEESRVLVELAGSRFYMPYRTIGAHDGEIDIEHVDPLSGQLVVKTLLVRGDELWVRVRNLDFYEVFTRVE